MCSMATLAWLIQSHFRVVVIRFSLAPTSERRLWTLLGFSHTLYGFSLPLEKAISCLYHLMHCCPTRLIFSLFHLSVPPLLISLVLTSDLDGTIVIGVCRPLLLSCYLYIRTTCDSFLQLLTFANTFISCCNLEILTWDLCKNPRIGGIYLYNDRCHMVVLLPENKKIFEELIVKFEQLEISTLFSIKHILFQHNNEQLPRYTDSSCNYE